MTFLSKGATVFPTGRYYATAACSYYGVSAWWFVYHHPVRAECSDLLGDTLLFYLYRNGLLYECTADMVLDDLHGRCGIECKHASVMDRENGIL